MINQPAQGSGDRETAAISVSLAPEIWAEVTQQLRDNAYYTTAAQESAVWDAIDAIETAVQAAGAEPVGWYGPETE